MRKGIFGRVMTVQWRVRHDYGAATEAKNRYDLEITELAAAVASSFSLSCMSVLDMAPRNESFEAEGRVRRAVGFCSVCDGDGGALVVCAGVGRSCAELPSLLLVRHGGHVAPRCFCLCAEVICWCVLVLHRVVRYVPSLLFRCKQTRSVEGQGSSWEAHRSPTEWDCLLTHQ